jgi:transposase
MAHKGARSRTRYATVKGRDGMVESLWVLTRARASALKARKAAIEQIRSLIVSAPDTVCDQ